MGRIRTSWTQMQSTAAEAEQASLTLQVAIGLRILVFMPWILLSLTLGIGFDEHHCVLSAHDAFAYDAYLSCS